VITVAGRGKYTTFRVMARDTPAPRDARARPRRPIARDPSEAPPGPARARAPTLRPSSPSMRSRTTFARRGRRRHFGASRRCGLTARPRAVSPPPTSPRPWRLRSVGAPSARARVPELRCLAVGGGGRCSSARRRSDDESLVLAIDRARPGRPPSSPPRVPARALRRAPPAFPRPGCRSRRQGDLAIDATAVSARRATGILCLDRGDRDTNQRENRAALGSRDRPAPRPAMRLGMTGARPNARRSSARAWKADVRRRTGLVLDPYFSATRLMDVEHGPGRVGWGRIA